MAERPRWWDMRPSQSSQPKTYTCPFCHERLLAMNPHTLLFPEGDRERRRHAHTACVAAQHQAGRLLSRSEWERSQRPPREPGSRWWERLLGRGRS